MIKSFTIAVCFILSLFFSTTHATTFKCLSKAIKHHLNTLATSHVQRTSEELIDTRIGKIRFPSRLLK